MSQHDTNAALAARLKTALESRDRDLLDQLLAPNVRWGGEEETPDTCHNRTDVLRWYEELDAHGVRARVEETINDSDAIVLGLRITWPDHESSEARMFTRYQVFRVVDGLIVDIRGYPTRSDALATTDMHVRDQ